MSGNSQYADFTKLNYMTVVMDYVQVIGKQVLRLPHENIVIGSATPNGTTHENIIESFYESVEVFESMLAPYLNDRYKQEIRPLVVPVPTMKDYTRQQFLYGKAKFAALINLCDDLRLLLPKVRKNTTAFGEVYDDESDETTGQIDADITPPEPSKEWKHLHRFIREEGRG